MPTDWSDDIAIAKLADEPQLSEEFAALFGRLNAGEGGPAPHVILDFANVTFLNSSHLAQMLRMRKRLLHFDRQLILCALCDDLHAVLGVTGLDRVFQVAADTPTALAALQLSEYQGRND